MSKRRRSRRKKLPQEPVEATIQSLTPECRGFAHINGKATFVDFALPGERVMFKYTKTSSKFDEGMAVEVLEASTDRVEPPCEHFGVCGGCSLQHMHADAQIQAKQNTLLNHLQHMAQVEPETVLEPLLGPTLGYRYKARLGVRYVAKKEKVLVGFREKSSAFLANLNSCKVLHASVGERLEQLGCLIMGMEARQTIPQIEVAVSDTKTTLIFRHLKPLSNSDTQALIDFAKAENIQIFLQSGGADTVKPLCPEQPDTLFYEIKNHGVRIEFHPLDFTQVNPVINNQMLDRALEFLDLNDQDKVLDLFCGLGNFTLPMAKYAGHVTGVEGSDAMVVKARDNARLNKIENVEFHGADLSVDLTAYSWLKQAYDKILLDPPRSGAMEMLKYLGKLKAKRIVYVSCHPATLARDAKVLIHDYGYKLTSAGVMDMFPHTAHVESIAVFDKK
jgi:23S rRNA (uracil1939-C5)-methyltransferase